MVKWLSNIEGKKNRSLVPSTIITLFIVGMLILSGPAQAVAVNISGLQDSYTKGSEINFQVNIELNDPDKYVSITNISLNLTGPANRTIIFALDGTRISKECNIKIKPISIPKDVYGYGNGYGYDSKAGYGYDFGYGYGYGYGNGGGGGKINFIYNVTIDTSKKCLQAGNYSVVASLNSGSNVVFQSPVSNFKLLKSAPGENIKAKVDIKPETINLASKGTFTAFINLDEEYDVRDINISTLDIMGAHAVSSKISNEDDGTLIAKFNRQDLKNVQTGNAVVFTLKGKVDGSEFVAYDTVKVINNGKDVDEEDECECEDHEDEQEDDEDECNDHSKEKDNDKKIKEYKPAKNQNNNQNIRNNGAKGAITNNIVINGNTGTVNVNIINNYGGGTEVTHYVSDKEENNKQLNTKEKENNKGNNGKSSNTNKGKNKD